MTDEPEEYELRVVVSEAVYDRLGSLADFLGIDDLGVVAAYILAQAPELQPPRRVSDAKKSPTHSSGPKTKRRRK